MVKIELYKEDFSCLDIIDPISLTFQALIYEPLELQCFAAERHQLPRPMAAWLVPVQRMLDLAVRSPVLLDTA